MNSLLSCLLACCKHSLSRRNSKISPVPPVKVRTKYQRSSSALPVTTVTKVQIRHASTLRLPPYPAEPCSAVHQRNQPLNTYVFPRKPKSEQKSKPTN